MLSVWALLLPSLLVPLAQVDARPPGPPRNSPMMRTIANGEMSGVSAARQVVARTTAEWAVLWKGHQPNAPAPKVDFARETVAAVFMGMRPTAGYAVEIAGVRRDGDALVVEYREISPPRSVAAAQILTSPFHIVAVPLHAGDVRFRRIE